MKMVMKKSAVLIMALVMAGIFIPLLGQKAIAEDGSGNEAKAAPGDYVISSDNTEIYVDDLTYNGQYQIPDVTVYYDWDRVLKLNRDYTLQFIDSNGNTTSAETGIRNTGRYLLTVTGIGDYTGALTKTVQVKAASITSVKANQKTVTYNGNKRFKTITVKAKVNGAVKILKKGTDYTVAYKNNRNVGKATITIKGKGNYKGTFKRTFKIRPKATWLRYVRPLEFGFKAKWAKKTTQVTGYQIQYSRKSSFSTKRTITIRKNWKIRRSFKNLVGGKKYYVRVRTYKTVNGTKYFSKWSKKKTVKTKGWKKISFKKVKKYTKGHLTKRELACVFEGLFWYRSHKNISRKGIKKLGHKSHVRCLAMGFRKMRIRTANKKLSFFTDFRFKKNRMYGVQETDSKWVTGGGFGETPHVKVTRAEKCGNRIRIWLREYIYSYEEDGSNKYVGPYYVATLKKGSSGYYLYSVKKKHVLSLSRYNLVEGMWGPWEDVDGYSYVWLKFTRDRIKKYYSYYEDGYRDGDVTLYSSKPLWWTSKKNNGTIVYYCAFKDGEYFILSEDREWLSWRDSGGW